MMTLSMMINNVGAPAASWATDAIWTVFETIVEWGAGQAAELLGYDITNFSFLDKLEFIWVKVDRANAVFPFVDCMTILLAGFGVKAVIRGVRWVMAFIPFVNAG